MGSNKCKKVRSPILALEEPRARRAFFEGDLIVEALKVL